jgi:hypothetical protein
MIGFIDADRRIDGVLEKVAFTAAFDDEGSALSAQTAFGEFQ